MKSKKITLLVIVLSAWSFFLPKFCHSQVNVQDSLALLDLYNNTGGENWTHSEGWLNGPVKNWFGITVVSGKVTGIILPGNQLLGSLPVSIGNLNSLSILDVSSNQINGSIPAAMGNLVNLDSLNLNNNQFTGSFPVALCNVVNLKNIRVASNQLSGNIPVETGNLENIIRLDLSNNKLSGLIPSSAGNLINIKVLDLSYNMLGGKLPVEISGLQQADTLNIAYNNFNFDDLIDADTYPHLIYSPQSEIKLKYKDNILTAFAGGSNGNNYYTWFKNGNQIARIFSDSIFIEEGTAIYTVKVHNYNVPGLLLFSNEMQVVSPLFATDSLALVDLYNSTNGAGWKEPWNLSGPHWNWAGIKTKAGRVNKLQLSNENLSGAIPASLATEKVSEISLDNNNLTGTIPASLGYAGNLVRLNLSTNNLSGTIPGDLGYLMKGTYLDLSNNNLNGPIPSGLGNAPVLNYLNLSGNQLNGTIPGSLSQCPLSYLNLAGNLLTGGIPMLNLNTKSLYLNNNQLSGYIPDSFQYYSEIQEISLHHNQLSGEIPAYFGNLAKLGLIDLSHNLFTGPIPWSIGFLKNLFMLNLNNNHFSGYIPLSLYSRLLYFPPNISHNDFTFDGMEEFASHYPLASYAPQAEISLNFQHNTLTVTAGGTLENNTYEWYRNGELVGAKTSDSSFIISEEGTYHVVVSNSFAHKLTLKGTALHLPGNVSICASAGSRLVFNDSLQGVTHQWQMNNGNGFINISDGINYSGTKTGTLTLGNIPASWNGYSYRCKVNGTSGGEYTLRIVNKWTGAVSNNWEDAGNWECQQVPDQYSTVIIEQGIVNVNAAATIYSLSVSPGVAFHVKPGTTFTIRH